MLKLKVGLSVLCVLLVACVDEAPEQPSSYNQALQLAIENVRLNAFISLDGDVDLSEVQDGRLSGMVLAVKDNIHVSGLANTAGTPSLEKFVPDEDAAAIKRLKSEGAIILGKTNLHELTFGITGVNAYFGPARNPYGEQYFAGGSSSGSAVAVSARIVPAAICTDTGGSLRIPAALTGIIGFRPSLGRYSDEGVLVISPTRDVIGPMALTIAHIALLDSVMADRPEVTIAADLRNVRLGVARGAFFDDIEEETEIIMEASLEKLRGAGVTIVEADIDDFVDLSKKASGPIAIFEAMSSLQKYLKEYDTGVDFLELVNGAKSPHILEVLKRMAEDQDGDGAPDGIGIQADYDNAINNYRPALIALYEEYFASNNIDALVFPTTVRPASLIEGSEDSVLHNGRQVNTFSTYIRNTNPGSTAGLPGISIPMGITSEGLPVGLSLDALQGDDDQLLSIALAIEPILGKISAPR